MLYKKFLNQNFAKLIFSVFGIKHLPPTNFFKNTLLKRIIYPNYIRLELTHQCSLNCIMCPSFLRTPEAGKKELAFEEIRKVIDELSGYRPRPYISVSGGEPFLRPDIFDILKYLECRGLKYKILTNAAGILQGAKERLIGINPDIFQVSLDGPEHIHDKIRQTPGAFSRTTEALRYLKENARFKILLMCIISSINSEYLHDIVMTAEELGIDLCFGHLSFIDLKRFDHQKKIMKEEFGIDLDDSRRSDITNLYNLDTGRLFEQITKIRKEKAKINIYFTQELSKEQIAKHYSDSECCVFSDKCYYPWYGARIDPYGEVSICKDNYFAVGNIKESPLAHLYNNCQANMFRGYLRKNLLPLCLRCCWCGSGDLMTTVFGRCESLT